MDSVSFKGHLKKKTESTGTGTRLGDSTFCVDKRCGTGYIFIPTERDSRERDRKWERGGGEFWMLQVNTYPHTIWALQTRSASYQDWIISIFWRRANNPRYSWKATNHRVSPFAKVFHHHQSSSGSRVYSLSLALYMPCGIKHNSPRKYMVWIQNFHSPC